MILIVMVHLCEVLIIIYINQQAKLWHMICMMVLNNWWIHEIVEGEKQILLMNHIK